MIKIEGAKGLEMSAIEGQVYDMYGKRVMAISGEECSSKCAFFTDDVRCLYAPECTQEDLELIYVVHKESE